MASTFAVVAVTLVICILTVDGRPEDSVSHEVAVTLENELADYMALAKTKEQQRCLKDLVRGAWQELKKMKGEYDAQKQAEEENSTDSSLTSSTPSASDTSSTSSSSEELSTSSSSEYNSSTSEQTGDEEEVAKYEEFLDWVQQKREAAAKCVQ